MNRFSFLSARRVAWLLVSLGWVFFGAGRTLAAEDDNLHLQVRQLWQLIDYVAVDYAGAVVDGQIANASEFQEMVEFATTIRSRVDSLPSREGRQLLAEQSRALEAAVSRHAAAAEVSQLAHGLASQLLTSYPIPFAPKSLPVDA